MNCLHEVHDFLAADQQNGHELRNCRACGTTLAIPLTWVSPYPEDYIPGHEDNAWGAFDPQEA